MDVLVVRLVQILQVREGRLAQPARPGYTLAEDEQAHAQPVAALGALQAAPAHQFPEQAVRGGLGQAGTRGQLGQGQLDVGRAESVQKAQSAGEYRLWRARRGIVHIRSFLL